MSYLVARMQKLKTQNLGGIQKHNQREFENNSNKDIDKERSHLNYDLVNDENIDYREKIMDTIDSQKTSTRATRKDAVLTNEWIVTSDDKFFEGKTDDQKREFFEASTEFFESRYGEQNVAYAQVHMDESTPHMHIGVVPMKDGKLSSKKVFDRKELLAVQEELPKHLAEKGFYIFRGEKGSERKHLKVDEYKEMREKMSAMDEEISFKSEHLFDLNQNTEQTESRLKEKMEEEQRLDEKFKIAGERTNEFEKQGPVKFNRKMIGTDKQTGEKMKGVFITNDEAERLDNLQKDVPDVLSENHILKYRNGALEKRNDKLNVENHSLKQENSGLKDSHEKIGETMKLASSHSEKTTPDGGTNAFAQVMQFALALMRRTKREQKIMDLHWEDAFKDVPESPEGESDYEDWVKRRQKHLKMKKVVSGMDLDN